MSSASSEEFNLRLADFIKALHKAKKRKANLTSNSFYSNKVRSELASLRKAFLALKRDYPSERYPKVAFQLATIDPLLHQIITTYPANLTDLLRLAEEIVFITQSDLAAELEAKEISSAPYSFAPFIPNDLIEDRHYVLKRVLWEINRCYDVACYNACAVMIRRIIECLIIQSFEHLGIENKIKKGDDYLDLSALIGMAMAEPKLGLTRNTKRILPDLKFFGDLGAHNRRALVHKEDLDKLHQATRSAIDELVYNI